MQCTRPSLLCGHYSRAGLILLSSTRTCSAGSIRGKKSRKYGNQGNTACHKRIISPLPQAYPHVLLNSTQALGSNFEPCISFGHLVPKQCVEWLCGLAIQIHPLASMYLIPEWVTGPFLYAGLFDLLPTHHFHYWVYFSTNQLPALQNVHSYLQTQGEVYFRLL